MDDTIDIPVQVNGKVRSVISVAAEAAAADLQAAAEAYEKLQSALAGRLVKRVIAVPGRLIKLRSSLTWRRCCQVGSG